MHYWLLVNCTAINFDEGLYPPEHGYLTFFISWRQSFGHTWCNFLPRAAMFKQVVVNLTHSSPSLLYCNRTSLPLLKTSTILQSCSSEEENLIYSRYRWIKCHLSSKWLSTTPPRTWDITFANTLVRNLISSGDSEETFPSSGSDWLKLSCMNQSESGDVTRRYSYDSIRGQVRKCILWLASKQFLPWRESCNGQVCSSRRRCWLSFLFRQRYQLYL